MDRSLARFYKSDVEHIGKKPSLIQMLQESSKGKRDLARALKKTMVSAKANKTPVMNGSKDTFETPNGKTQRTVSGSDRTPSNSNDLPRSIEEKRHALIIDRGKQKRDGMILRTPVRKPLQNETIDKVKTMAHHTKLISRNIDLLPSRTYSIIANGQNRLEEEDQNHKNSLIKQLRSVSTKDADHTTIQSSETEANRRHPGDNVSLNASEEYNGLKYPSTQINKDKRKSPPNEGETGKEKNNIEDNLPEAGSTAQLQEQHNKGRQNTSREGASSRGDRLKLLHSLKHLLKEDSNSFSALQTQLRRRNSTPMKIWYQNVSTNDMMSPTEVENELNKLAINLSKLREEVWDIKSSVEAGLKMTKNTINAEE